MADLSVIYPLYNEEHHIQQNVERTIHYLENERRIDQFELLLCPNGCTDGTETVAQRLARLDHKIICCANQQRGLGVGIMAGIVKSRFPFGMFYAIDLPFGLDVIGHSLAAVNDHDLVIGSKGHPDSKVSRSNKRQLITLAFRIFLDLVFNLRVADTQGSLLWRSEKLKQVLPALTATSAFLETQIIIYFRALGYTIKEIPVEFNNELRPSKIPILKESARIIREIIVEKSMLPTKLQKIREVQDVSINSELST